MALALMLLGCATGPSRMPQVRPIDEDQLALLPAGADAIIDVDMDQIRTWAPAHRFFALLPPEVRTQLTQIGVDPWLGLDGIVMSLSGLGTDSPSTTMLLRGDLDADKLAAGLGAAPGEYREMKLWEGPSHGLAKLSPRMFALGAPVDVRRVVDLVRGQGESMRQADQTLVAALARAPSMAGGRPAVIAALVPSLPLRERLRDDQLPGGEYQWLTFVLAVGDGFDFEIIGKTASVQKAGLMVAEVLASLDKLRARPLVRILGLAPYLNDVMVSQKRRAPDGSVDKLDEVRVIYRLARPLVNRMLSSLEQVQAAAGTLRK